MKVEEIKIEKEKGKSLANEHNNEYKIYNFLKKNPGLLLGMGSTLIVFLSAFIKSCSYLYERGMLLHWGVNPVFIDVSASIRIYETIGLLCFSLIVFVCLLINGMLVKKCGPIRRRMFYFRQLRKLYEKNSRKIHCELLSEFIHHFRWSKSNMEKRENLKRIKKDICELNENIKSAKRKIRKYQCTYDWVIFGLLVISSFIYCSLDYVLYRSLLLEQIIASAIVSIFILLLFKLCRILDIWLDKKEIKQCAVQDFDQNTMQRDVPDITPHLKQFLSEDFKFRFSDKEAKRALCSISTASILLLCGLVIIFLIQGYHTASNQKNFMIVTIDEVEFAVVYSNSKYVILEECKYKDTEETLEIYGFSQRIFPIEGLVYEVHTYKHVKKV